MTEGQKKKRNFRSSKKWKEFRHKKSVEQKGIDPITLKKLYKMANLHHMDLDEKKYEDLSKPENFVYLNKNTHDVIHFLYTYYKNDTGILDRLKYYLDKMVEINKGNFPEEN